jgi:hypothetical protein
VLMVAGVVRCYPIIYYNQKARNASLNYLRALPSVLQWIGACACVTLVVSDHPRYTHTHTHTHIGRI